MKKILEKFIKILIEEINIKVKTKYKKLKLY